MPNQQYLGLPLTIYASKQLQDLFVSTFQNN